MKKLLFILSVAAVFVACGHRSASAAVENDTVSVDTVEQIVEDVETL